MFVIIVFFLFNALRSRNHIVSTCMNIALDNSNPCIGYKLAFYRYRYNIGMYSNINYSIKLLRGVPAIEIIFFILRDMTYMDMLCIALCESKYKYTLHFYV